MIVIADSGSTKTDWRIVQGAGEETISKKTMGFNPYFHSTKVIYDELESQFSSIADKLDAVKDVYFYGAGCSDPVKSLIVKDALSAIFKNANINVFHDMFGAARATLGDEPGIACIIGTGSNSCVWDGKIITDNIPSHGYIFGDEGSGSYLGREVLKLFLNNEMDDKLKKSFLSEYNVTEAEILNKAYKQENANVFLASFAKFCNIEKDSEQIKNIVNNGFQDYFNRRVIPYKTSGKLNLGFVGSIAFYFKEILEEVAKEHGYKVVSINKCPVDNLINYHSSNILTTH